MSETEVFSQQVLPHRVEGGFDSAPPDKEMRFGKVGINDSVATKGSEWNKPGGKIDLTDEAQSSFSNHHTLVQLEGDERPKYVLGNGQIIDIEASMKLGRIVAADMRQHVDSEHTLVIAIGSPLTPNGGKVSRVLRESMQLQPVQPGEVVYSSPLEDVKQKLGEIYNKRGLEGAPMPQEVSSLLST